MLAPNIYLQKKVKETDLENISPILTSHDCNFRTMLIEALSKQHIAPKIVLETSSKEILKQFAMNQLGVTFMPGMTIEKETKNHTLVKLDWKGNAFPIFSQIFIHKDKHINVAMTELTNNDKEILTRRSFKDERLKYIFLKKEEQT